ncbi:MAG: tetratricopeptide repeat-containing serine protease family protein [Rhodomicrobium sp.]
MHLHFRFRTFTGLFLRYPALAPATILAAAIVAAAWVVEGMAGPLEDADAAYRRKDFERALPLYRSAANEGNVEAQVTLGDMYKQGQGVDVNYGEALKWYRLAARQGYSAAQADLGFMYSNGLGVPQSYLEAQKWFLLAASQGSAVAEFDLGIMHKQGLGVTKDYAQAEKWLRAAAEHGSAAAQLNLGMMYYRGFGVRKDHGEAAKWYRLAAEQGDVFSLYSLGVMYYLGQGVPQNYSRSYFWSSLAAARGNMSARRIRDTVARLVSPAQIAEAQRQAAQWQPKPIKAAAPHIPVPKAAEPVASGTAFFVAPTGEALTNAHVVDGCREIHVNGMAAWLLARDTKNDLALIATGMRLAGGITWRISVQQGEDIIAYGFPLAGILSSGGNVVTGNVTALAGLQDDSRFLQISAPVQPGNSGGPIFDRQGNVVGVVVSKLNVLRYASITGDIAQNVNFAIKASVALLFLDAQRIPHSGEPDGQNTSSQPLSTPEITRRAQELVAHVVCSR